MNYSTAKIIVRDYKREQGLDFQQNSSEDEEYKVPKKRE